MPWHILSGRPCRMESACAPLRDSASAFPIEQSDPTSENKGHGGTSFCETATPSRAASTTARAVPFQLSSARRSHHPGRPGLHAGCRSLSSPRRQPPPGALFHLLVVTCERHLKQLKLYLLVMACPSLGFVVTQFKSGGIKFMIWFIIFLN